MTIQRVEIAWQEPEPADNSDVIEVCGVDGLSIPPSWVYGVNSSPLPDDCDFKEALSTAQVVCQRSLFGAARAKAGDAIAGFQPDAMRSEPGAIRHDGLRLLTYSLHDCTTTGNSDQVLVSLGIVSGVCCRSCQTFFGPTIPWEQARCLETISLGATAPKAAYMSASEPRRLTQKLKASERGSEEDVPPAQGSAEIVHDFVGGHHQASELRVQLQWGTPVESAGSSLPFVRMHGVLSDISPFLTN